MRASSASGPAPGDGGSAPSSFGEEASWALGIEEELLVVDAAGDLLSQGDKVAEESDPPDGAVEEELFKAMVEAKSEPRASAREATGELRRIRPEMLGAGPRLMGSGVHPSALSAEAEIQGTPRYAAIWEDLRGILRTPICGLHVHVGVPDEETAIRAYNGVRTHIPLLNALAANSPFWFGEDSGLASARTAIFRSYPRAAMAPEFKDFADFRRVTDQVVAAAGVDDYTYIWWDARVHPALGTVEVRAMDVQFDLRRVAALSALTHCLIRVEAESEQAGIPAREALAESSFQATRYGLKAKLIDRNAQPLPAEELATRTLERARSVAAELDCAPELNHIETMIEEGTGADVQRRVKEQEGMDGLLEFLMRATAEFGDPAGLALPASRGG